MTVESWKNEDSALVIEIVEFSQLEVAMHLLYSGKDRAKSLAES